MGLIRRTVLEELGGWNEWVITEDAEASLRMLKAGYSGLYIAKAFITVITGGAAIIAGTVSSSVIFGTINQIVSFGSTPVIGEIAMLALAIILLRLMPQGITGRFFRNST